MKELCPPRGHPNGSSSVPHFEIRGRDVCPTRGHPVGSSSIPHYELRGDELRSLWFGMGFRKARSMRCRGARRGESGFVTTSRKSVI